MTWIIALVIVYAIICVVTFSLCRAAARGDRMGEWAWQSHENDNHHTNA